MGSKPAFAALALSVISLVVASLLFIDMESLKSAQHGLGTTVSRLSNELESLKLSLKELGRGLDEAKRSINALTTRLTNLSRSMTELGKDLEKRIQSVRSYADELASRLEKNANAIARLSKSITKINTTYSLAIAALTKALNYTISAERLLNQRVASLSLSIENNSAHIKKLTTETEKLRREIEAMNRRMELMNSSLTEIRKNLITKLTGLETSISIVDKRYFYASKSYLTKLLESVVKERIVAELALRLGLEGNLTQRAIKVFTFIENNLAYCHDPYAPIVLVNGSIYIAKDLIELPNETIARGCGDCEDLALLAYALLAATKRPGESFYLIFVAWKHSKIAHAAVLAIDRIHHIALILDPAGNWLNGIEAWITMFVENTTGASYIIGLWPLDLSNYTKVWLERDSFAQLTYEDLASGKNMLKPRIHLYSPYTLVAAWLKAWGKPVKRIDVYGVGVHKTFRTELDFAAWIQSQLYS